MMCKLLKSENMTTAEEEQNNQIIRGGGYLQNGDRIKYDLEGTKV